MSQQGKDTLGRPLIGFLSPRHAVGLIALAGILLLPVASVPAILATDPAIPERTLTDNTSWWWYYGQSESSLKSRYDRNRARIIDIEVESASPHRFSAAMVANAGPHASGWWWYYGQTESSLKSRYQRNRARILDLEAYQVDGRTRFAAVLVPNTGSNAVSWWWYYGLTFDGIGQRLNQHSARLVDLDAYTVNGQRRYAAVMVSNKGSLARGWWYYINVSADFIATKLSENRARLLDVESLGSGRFMAIMVRENDLNPGRDVAHYQASSQFAVLDRDDDTATRLWWYHGVSAGEIQTIWRRHWGRIVDVESVGTGRSRTFSVLLLDNGIRTTGQYVPSLASFDKQVVDLMKQWSVPGAALAVVKGGRLVLARGYGLGDLEQGANVQPDHLFRIASVSKPVTRSAIFRLRNEGKLSLTDKAFDHLAYLKPNQLADPRIDDITIQHLLDHTAGWDINKLGFDPMFYSDQVASALNTSRPSSCANVIRYMLANHPLNDTPGATNAYSNFGYCILGRIVEQVSGQPYEQHVQQAILTPAGISKMRIGRSLLSGRAPGEVKYYDRPLAPLASSVFPSGANSVPWPYGGFYLEAMDAHGGWIASAVDLARYALDATPTPYSGNWAFEGSLPGTRSRVVRSGDLIMAVVFNTRPIKDIDQALNQASAAVNAWPGHDLFGLYN